MKNQEKKIKLMLKDFLFNHKNYNFNDTYLEIYDEYDEVFQKIFAYFHEKLNNLFDFMNHKSSINNHYNADDSRELIYLIDELRDIKKTLNNTNYHFNINNSYVEQIKFVQTFLQQSGGSSIPKKYKKFEIIKYESIFKLKNNKISIGNLNTKKFSEANFKNKLITLNINENILMHIESFLNSRHYFSAVEEAYKIVREKLRKITGDEQAHKAFSKNNYEKIFGHVAKNQVEEDFFEGIKFLHMAIQKLRNEKSHTPAKEIDKNLALHYIVLSSLAYDLIDNK